MQLQVTIEFQVKVKQYFSSFSCVNFLCTLLKKLKYQEVTINERNLQHRCTNVRVFLLRSISLHSRGDTLDVQSVIFICVELHVKIVFEVKRSFKVVTFY